MGGYRKTDPSTSKAAYLEIMKSGHLPKCRQQVFEKLYQLAKVEPPTAGEVADLLPNMNRNDVGTRISELVDWGVAVDVGKRKCRSKRKTNKVTLTWGLTGNRPVKPTKNLTEVERLRQENKKLKQALYKLRKTIGIAENIKLF